MYLSRVPLGLTNLDAIAFVSSPYKVHAAVEQAFAPSAVREDERGRILWRLDEVPGNEREVWLYVVSPDKPDFTHICDQVASVASPSWVTKEYDPALDRVSEGQLWQFRLKANPVRKVLVDKGRRGRAGVVGTLQGHVTEAQQRAWLMDRAEAHGFRIAQTEEGFERLTVSHRRRERFKRQGNVVTLTTAQYDGVLEVVDAETFRHTLGFGLGRARGFGCGLMTIAPLREPGDV
ncbi:type I-E CRISPR-associated protein Cas6/Cse3/CasE [Olsenella sp. SW781]|uniref:type I-E CRISPR-associated protein Cas6/Cse3/CasE n=1 Tax=Olsenella sp. SW781 TaxID=2530046 RepID=UPI00143A813A|nr:type I-E CRISPR-associated protein Cas6/Cse3/CasE [Olsenella sp. SW781]NJE81195.1 type I-E CRISPR-associated protein Cas6/Cse3/CasE [Olsenella sp. SW781]